MLTSATIVIHPKFLANRKMFYYIVYRALVPGQFLYLYTYLMPDEVDYKLQVGFSPDIGKAAKFTFFEQAEYWAEQESAAVLTVPLDSPLLKV